MDEFADWQVEMISLQTGTLLGDIPAGEFMSPGIGMASVSQNNESDVLTSEGKTPCVRLVFSTNS